MSFNGLPEDALTRVWAECRQPGYVRPCLSLNVRLGRSAKRHLRRFVDIYRVDELEAYDRATATSPDIARACRSLHLDDDGEWTLSGAGHRVAAILGRATELTHLHLGGSFGAGAHDDLVALRIFLLSRLRSLELDMPCASALELLVRGSAGRDVAALTLERLVLDDTGDDDESLLDAAHDAERGACPPYALIAALPALRTLELGRLWFAERCKPAALPCLFAKLGGAALHLTTLVLDRVAGLAAADAVAVILSPRRTLQRLEYTVRATADADHHRVLDAVVARLPQLRVLAVGSLSPRAFPLSVAGLDGLPPGLVALGVAADYGDGVPLRVTDALACLQLPLTRPALRYLSLDVATAAGGADDFAVRSRLAARAPSRDRA